MYLKHKIYGKLFNLFTKFSINDKQISFILDSANHLREIWIILKRNLKKEEISNLTFFIRINYLFPVLKDWLLPDMYF